MERKTLSLGKDKVDHGPSGHDDAANVVAGSLVLATRTIHDEAPLVAPIIISKSQPPPLGTSTTQAFYDYYSGGKQY